MMRLYTDNLALRIGGTVMGLMFLAIGVFALVGAQGGAEVAEPDRVSWFGITAVIAGVASIGFALLEPRIDQVFRAPPKRWIGRKTRRDG